jgi:ribonuclease D
VTKTAEHHTLPPENLITPDYIRRLAWEPPAELSAESVTGVLTRFGARAWQCELLATELAEALGSVA